MDVLFRLLPALATVTNFTALVAALCLLWKARGTAFIFIAVAAAMVVTSHLMTIGATVDDIIMLSIISAGWDCAYTITISVGVILFAMSSPDRHVKSHETHRAEHESL